MPTFDEFRTLVEADLLATPASCLDYLKVVINHLSIARLDHPQTAGAASGGSTQIALACYVLGTLIPRDASDNNLVFQPMGEVVLPWCRLPNRESGVTVSGPLPGSNRELDPFVTVRVLEPQVPPGTKRFLGEGHRRLYDAIAQWYQQLRQLEMVNLDLPWPQDQSLDSVRSPILIARSGAAFDLRAVQFPSALPGRLRAATGILAVPVSGLRPTDRRHGVDAIVLVVLIERDNDQGRLTIRRLLTETIANLASKALCFDVDPGEGCGECKGLRDDKRSGEQGHKACTPIQKGLCRLHHDLVEHLEPGPPLGEEAQLMGSPAGPATGLPTERTPKFDDVLFMLRDVDASLVSKSKQSGSLQKVRYVWFPLQLRAMRLRFQDHCATVHPFEHLLRCAALFGGLHGEQPATREQRERREVLTDTVGWFFKNIRKEAHPELVWLENVGGGHDRVSREETIEIPVRDLVDLWDPTPRAFVPPPRGAAVIGATWSLVERALVEERFPLDMGLSNSTMNGNAFELVSNWTAEGRASGLLLGSPHSGDESGSGVPGPSTYPASLLIAEAASISPMFSKGVLYVPWVAPVASPATTGEYPAFGAAILASEGSAFDATRAALIARNYAGRIHTALLDEVQQSLVRRLGEPNLRRTSSDESVKDAIVRVLSLSGRISEPRPLTKVATHQHRAETMSFNTFTVSNSSFSVDFEPGAFSSAFHRQYAEMIASVMTVGGHKGFRRLEELFGHEAGKLIESSRLWFEHALRTAEQGGKLDVHKWMITAALDYVLLYVDSDGKQFHANQLPKPWFGLDRRGRSFPKYVETLARWAWRVFARKASLAFSLSPDDSLAKQLTDLPTLDDSAGRLVFVAEPQGTMKFVDLANCNLHTINSELDDDRFGVLLARWLIAAVENGMKHVAAGERERVMERPEGVSLANAALTRWTQLRSSGEERIELSCRTIEEGVDEQSRRLLTEIVVENPCSGPGEANRASGTGLVLSVTAAELGGTLAEWGPSESGERGWKWRAVCRIPGLRLFN